MLFVHFSINKNSSWGSELSRDPGSSMGDVQHDCCFYSCYESWFVVAFPQETRGGLFSPLIRLISFCAENVCVSVFFSKLWKIFGRLVHVHLENNGLAHLISSTWLWKMLSNCKWYRPLKREIRRHTKMCDL